MACTYIILTVTFKEQNFFLLKKSDINFIYFMECDFGVVSKNASLNSGRSSPMLFSTSFMALHFTFGSMTHFEFILERC